MLHTGNQLGPYEILAALGAGGMGEVYRARDKRLGRDVAVKILPPHFAGDPDRRQRFEREAKAVAALSHPNILALYDVGAQDGVTYLVLELLEGESLRERLNGGPLPWRKAVELGIGIADGLSAAHAKGVIHRDLKPQNLFITADGRVKILDFGLARIGEEASPFAETGPYSPSPTKTGAVMGTIGYMSPEQVRGQALDARSDIFSLGCVLHEMISGRPPFARETAADTQTAILREEPPPLSPSRAEQLPELDRVIRHCLEKNREERFQTARDLRFALAAALSDSRQSDRRAIGPGPRASRLLWRGLSVAGVVVLLAALAGIASQVYQGWQRNRATVAGPAPGADQPIAAVAVLPFENVERDARIEHLAESIPETINRGLLRCRLRDLHVRSLLSVAQYSGRKPTLEEIRQELGVGAVVTGKVQRQGENLIVSLSLIDVRDGNLLWDERYEEKLDEIQALQDRIAKDIAANLRLRLTSEEERRLTRRDTQNAEALQLYQMGRYFWNKRTPEALQKAVECFEKAIQVDQNYAAAWEGLASTHCVTPRNSETRPTESYPKAKAAALRALEIDPQLAEAHAALALVAATYEWNWTEGERLFQRAIELDPNNGTVRQWYALFLLNTGQLDESRAQYQRAKELEPLSLIINAVAGRSDYFAGRYDVAIGQYRKTLELDPDFWVARVLLAETLIAKGAYAEAIRELETMKGRAHREPLELIGQAYARMGRRHEALQIIDQMQAQSREKYVLPSRIAQVYASLGEKQQALDWLEKGLAERDWLLGLLKNEPAYKDLRDEPRFIALLQRVGLADKAVKDQPLDTLAVLPFDNQSPDAEAGYLGDDITFSLTESLGRFRDLKVRSFSSASRFKDRSKSPVQAGRELQVPVVLTGTIQKRGEELVIFVELVDVQQDRPLWKQRYTGKFAERLMLQQSIVKDMPEKLRLALTGQEKQALAKLATQSLKAHELYIQGRLAWNRRTVADMKKAIEFFDQAIQLDPDYAQAYAGRADCYVLSPSYAFAAPKDASPKAREAALQALRRDPTLGEAHITLAEVKFWFDWDFPGAEIEFRRGLELKPTYATGRQWYGEFLSCMGRHDAAIAELRQAKQLDPEALIIRCDLARAYAFARRYDEAAAECRAALAKDHNFAMAHTFLGWILADQDKHAEAIVALETAYQLDPHHPVRVGLLGYAYGSAGKHAEARQILQHLRDLNRQKEVSPVFFAQVHMGLGDKDQALAELDRGFRERSPAMLRLIDPTFDPLRADPRFGALLKKMNLPP